MRSDLGPISVSAPGTSLTTAQGKHLTFNTRYPFGKLDSTNPVSFQIIRLFFNTEPPNPSAGNSNRTQVYQYPHGYKYIPSTWFLVSIDNFTTVKGSEGVWIIGNAESTNNATAILRIEVDATNITFYIDKFVANVIPPVQPNIIGYTINVRAYVFVEDLLGNSVPSLA